MNCGFPFIIKESPEEIDCTIYKDINFKNLNIIAFPNEKTHYVAIATN